MSRKLLRPGARHFEDDDWTWRFAFRWDLVEPLALVLAIVGVAVVVYHVALGVMT